MADISVCGTDCSACYCFGSMCSGCNACEGKVFHVPDQKTCAIYACTVQEKGLKNCGECTQVPCSIWTGMRDPKYSDEEFQQNIDMRVKKLREISQ